jgi:hypothetical protein
VASDRCTRGSLGLVFQMRRNASSTGSLLDDVGELVTKHVVEVA